jgi:2-C-methyl-D-erythritol 4-phosphate cytidylyltransferase
MKTDIVTIVPSAGLGKRFGTSARKPFVEIEGTPVLIHTLKRLHDIQSITEIIPVMREQDIESGQKLIHSHNLHKIKRISPGGKERQDSVYHALSLLKKHDGLVLIHDGVRPLVSPELIDRLLREKKGFDGVVPGLPVKETLKDVDADGVVVSTIKRETVWSIQTPQVFGFDVIKKAYESALNDGFYATDDAALVERTGAKVKIIPGSPFNIKITTPEDLEMVKYLLTKRIV